MTCSWNRSATLTINNLSVAQSEAAMRAEDIGGKLQIQVSVGGADDTVRTPVLTVRLD